MKILKFIRAVILVAISVIMLNMTVHLSGAADKSQPAVQQPQRSFTVKAVIPKNQINKQLTYYDLQVQPNQKQTLKLLVTNLGTKKLNVSVRINNAYTSQNGVISYDKPYVHLYKAQQPSLTELVKDIRHKKVTLDPQHSKVVRFTYQAPAKEFKGIILGGITASANVGDSDNKNLTIQNRIRYVTGVVLHSKSDPITSKLTMGSRVGAQSHNMQEGIGLELQNAYPVNLSQMHVRAHITSSKVHLPIRNLKNVQMAPNSTWQVFLPYNNLKAGNYVLHLHVKSKNGLEQDFTRKFTITRKQLGQLSANIKPRHTWPIMTWIILIIILGVILVIVYLLWVYVKGRHHN